jgi:hypothetical protein
MLLRSSCLLGVTFAVLCPSCGGDDDPPKPSELIVSIQTDVALPDSIDRLHLEVKNQAAGEMLHSRDIEVGAGKQLIPATLGFLPSIKDPTGKILIRLHAQKGSVVKMLREVVTTIPRQRIVRLSMPIRWLCDDSARAVASAPNVTIENATCPAGQTCIAGDCRDNAIDSASLPDYVEADVFGGGRCFDVSSCMIGATRPAIDTARCAFPRPTDLSKLNVALRVKNDGICDGGGPDCHVILDNGGVDGWRAVEDRIELPRAVCKRLDSKRIEAVVITSDRCDAKPETRPVCGAWTSVEGGATRSRDAGAEGDGASPPPPPPTEILGVVPKGATLYSFASQNPNVRGFDIRAVSSSLFYGYQSSRVAVIAAIRLPPPTPPEEAKPVELAQLNGRFIGPWFDDIGESVYWADNTKVFMSSTKNPGALPAGGNSNPGFQFYEYVDLSRAIDAANLFGATYDSSAISSFQRGATQGPVILGSALAKQRSVIVLVDRDPTGSVYLATTGNSATDRGQIERLPKQQGGSAFTVASIPKIALTALVRDGADFYVTGYSITGSSTLELSGAIYRVPVSGGNPELIMDKLSIPANLIVDGDRMYWTETPRDKPARIMRAPKAGKVAPEIVFETKNTTGQSTITSITAGPDRIYFAMVDEGQGKLFYLPK